ncbi:MAG: hypothetical protein A3E78_16520 [Alphaproteobacteria bacterium RIFCSPHIGHO2_12_FULL_63_12]|nr:MAG: hypothetical protein A3E78_16520 [Alphaproteobacteria bacterium RIFCSPHIGHO2_12_FULL_63_12]
MPRMLELTPHLIGDYLAAEVDGWRKVSVIRMDRLPLGASRETYRIDAEVSDASGATRNEKLILRRDPPASHVDSDRLTEFESYRAIYGRGIPVPRMIHLETDPERLGGAVSIAEDLRGFHNSEYQLQQPAWAKFRPALAQQMWTYMGKLAAIDTAGLGLEKFMPPATVKNASRLQFEQWRDKFRRDSDTCDPILDAVIRELQRTCPASAKLSMVHGDFRAGNFLYDDAGVIRAILDWEMAHIGDPHEDLAWSLSRVFSFGKDDRRSGLALKEEAISWWEEGAGFKVDRATLRWYELFTDLKAQALWTSAVKVWKTSENRDVILAYASWWLQNAQNKAMLETMGRL